MGDLFFHCVIFSYVPAQYEWSKSVKHRYIHIVEHHAASFPVRANHEHHSPAGLLRRLDRHIRNGFIESVLSVRNGLVLIVI